MGCGGAFDRFMLGMWTQADRGRMAKIEKKTKRYPSGLTDEEWARIEPRLPKPAKKGRKPAVDTRENWQRDPLRGALRRWLAYAAEQLSTLADGVLVVPPVRAATSVPHHS
jgi:hypothetical protein